MSNSSDCGICKNLSWIVPLVVTICFAIWGAGAYKSTKNYDYSYQFCDRNLVEVEKNISQLNDYYYFKSKALITNSLVLSIIENKKFEHFTIQKKIQTLESILKLANPKDTDKIDEFNLQSSQLLRRTRTANPSLVPIIEKMKTSNPGTLIEIYKGDLQRLLKRNDKIVEDTKYFNVFKKSVLLVQDDIKSQFFEGNENVLLRQMETVRINTDHLTLLHECVTNTFKSLDNVN